MSRENPFRQKTPDELAAQLAAAEASFGEHLVPAEERQETLGLPVEELRQRYPEEYPRYLAQLRISGRQIEVVEARNPQEYSDGEVLAIQEALSGTTPLSEKLGDRLNRDENVRRYSLALFFPAIRERVQTGELPEGVFMLRTHGRQRGLHVNFPDQSYAIKTYENPYEPRVAAIADELRIGPRQFPSIKGHLTEEFIKGSTVARLDRERCTPEFMERLGRQIGTHITKLHERNILINDQLLRDDFGKSHTIVTDSGEARFIDFGAAVDVSHYPDLTDEQIVLLMRSDPAGAMALMVSTEDEFRQAITNYKKMLTQQFPSKESLLRERESQLIQEGLMFLSQAVPNVTALAKGLEAEFDY